VRESGQLSLYFCLAFLYGTIPTNSPRIASANPLQDVKTIIG
jgi:hypothetical protein